MLRKNGLVTTKMSTILMFLRTIRKQHTMFLRTLHSWSVSHHLISSLIPMVLTWMILNGLLIVFVAPSAMCVLIVATISLHEKMLVPYHSRAIAPMSLLIVRSMIVMKVMLTSLSFMICETILLVCSLKVLTHS